MGALGIGPYSKSIQQKFLSWMRHPPLHLQSWHGLWPEVTLKYFRFEGFILTFYIWLILDSKGGMVRRIVLALCLRINLKCRKVTAWIDKLLLSHDLGLPSNEKRVTSYPFRMWEEPASKNKHTTWWGTVRITINPLSRLDEYQSHSH